MYCPNCGKSGIPRIMKVYSRKLILGTFFGDKDEETLCCECCLSNVIEEKMNPKRLAFVRYM